MSLEFLCSKNIQQLQCNLDKAILMPPFDQLKLMQFPSTQKHPQHLVRKSIFQSPEGCHVCFLGSFEGSMWWLVNSTTNCILLFDFPRLSHINTLSGTVLDRP